MNEIKVLRQLDHVNSIKLYEVYEGNQHIYLVSELVETISMLDYLVDNWPIDEY